MISKFPEALNFIVSETQLVHSVTDGRFSPIQSNLHG